MSDHFDPYYTWLGIPPEEQPADFYRLLGIRRFESNDEVIVNASDQRMAYLRTFQAGKRGSHSQKLLNEVSAAQVCLLDPAKKRAYDERLSRESAASDVAARPAVAIPVTILRPVVPPQPLPRAQPVHPQVAAPITPATIFARPEVPLPAPPFAQPLVMLPVSSRPLQPVVKPQTTLPASPLVLIAASSAAALALLIIGGVIWASWPRNNKDIVAKLAEESNVEPPAPIAPPMPPNIGPRAPLGKPSPLPTGEAITAAAHSAVLQVASLDPASVRHVVRFQASSAPMWARFTPDGKTLSLGSLGSPAVGSYATNGGGPSNLQIFTSVFALSADGTLLATARPYAFQSDVLGVQRLTGSARGTAVADRGFRLRGQATALAFSEDRRILFAACGNNERLLALSVLKDLEPIPVFRTNLTQVDWLDVRGDTLVCIGPSGAVEVHSVRGRKIVQELKVPSFPSSPAVLFEPAPQKLSLLVFAAEQAVVQQLSGSRTLDRFPLPGLTSCANLLAVSAAGDAVVLRDPAGIVVWNIAQNKAATRIDVSHPLRFCAIHSQPPLLAFEAPDAQFFLCDLGKLLARPHWQMPSGPGWAAAYPAARDSITLSKGDSAPRPGGQPPRNPLNPLATPAEEAAVQAAIEALRAKGVQGVESGFVQYVRIGKTELTAQEIDGLRLFPRLQTLDLVNCPSAPLVLERLRGLSTLSSVQLRGAPVGDQEMEALATLPGLTNVDLSKTKVTGAGLAKLKVLAQLTQIFLPEGTTADLLPELAKLTNLEHAIGWPPGITDADLQYVGHLTNLRTVILNQANLEGEGLVHLKNLKQIRHIALPSNLPAGAWPYLKDVQFEEIHSPQSLGDAQLEHLRGNPRRKDFTAAPQITAAGLRTLANFPAIEKLSLYACDQLTEEGLAALARFPVLKELQPPRELDPGWMRHIAQIRTLERLNVADCSRNLPVDVLAAHPTLRALELGKGFTDEDCAVLARMPALAEVHFRESGVTASGIGQLRGATRLERLTFRQVTLGIEEIKAIGTLKQLKYLSLHATGLSRQQIDGFRTAIPRIGLGWSD